MKHWRKVTTLKNKAVSFNVDQNFKFETIFLMGRMRFLTFH